MVDSLQPKQHTVSCAVLCCLAVCWVLLHVGSISMSRVVCIPAEVTALCSAMPRSAHNQWPFCLRWWMREKCSVSTFVVHTVSSPSPSLSLPIAVFDSSALFLVHAKLGQVNNFHRYQVLVYFWLAHTHVLYVRVLTRVWASPAFSRSSMLHDLLSVTDGVSMLLRYCASSIWLMLGVLLLCVSLVGVCVSSLQARVENEILNYKDLAALPKVKAIYEVQQPDLISSSYQPYHRYTSDDRLDTYSYGEVLLLHTMGQTLLLSNYWTIFKRNILFRFAELV